ncbi:MAG: M28 family peptidase [Candidatus Lokiarchaeota archaeon]|nr:M28 family peptidase [Candidatus Lokiarchaeota archaeon]
MNINTTHYRIPGTQGRDECAKYIISKFQQIDSNFTCILHNFTVNSVGCQNLLFKMNLNYSNILILGSHYDSRARATKDPVDTDAPVPGANDGASGSAVLIELANILFKRKDELSVQIWFLFFDAEDQGYDLGPGISGWDWCEGSERFVIDITGFYNNSKENFDAMILLDMVGGTNLQFINEQRSTSSLLDELFQTGRELGYTNQFPSNPIVASISDDHVAFIDYGIPSADLIINFWNNPNWPYHHTTQDDLIHISNYSLEVTGKTVEQFIYNNYYNSSNHNSQWSNDINLLDTDTLIILISLISIIGVISIILYLRYKLRRIRDNENLNRGMKISNII